MTEISTLRPARHTALPDGRLPETGTRLDRALSGLLIVLSAFIRLFLTSDPLQLIPTITWVAATLALPGAAAAVLFLRRRAIAWLSWTLIGSAGYAVVQKLVFIDRLDIRVNVWPQF